MGKNRILKTPTYLSVFVCCFISGAFAGPDGPGGAQFLGDGD